MRPPHPENLTFFRKCFVALIYLSNLNKYSYHEENNHNYQPDFTIR